MSRFTVILTYWLMLVIRSDIHGEFQKVIIKFKKASPFFYSMFSYSKNIIFERKIKIFHAALFFQIDY